MYTLQHKKNQMNNTMDAFKLAKVQLHAKEPYTQAGPDIITVVSKPTAIA